VHPASLDIDRSGEEQLRAERQKIKIAIMEVRFEMTSGVR
jgi:hypothetical protein